MTTLVWLQKEFRVTDHPSLVEALSQSEKVVIGYFFDPDKHLGGAESANTVFTIKALKSLQQEITALGGELQVFYGSFEEALAIAIEQYDIETIHYSYQVGEPFFSQQLKAVEVCQSFEVNLKPYYSEFLFAPHKLLNSKQLPYRVFTPFYKHLLASQHQIDLPITNRLTLLDWQKSVWTAHAQQSIPEALLAVEQQVWAKAIFSEIVVSEAHAWQVFESFCQQALYCYETERDFPALDATSHLAAYINSGLINARQIYFFLQEKISGSEINSVHAAAWLRQVIWGEFAKYILHWFPETETQPFKAQFLNMPWHENNALLEVWKQGKTGIPIIDAGMRQLWQTGNMHNRVRMLVASFLTKNLSQHWLLGKAWFDFTLLDADPAKNIMGWQWVAGCGVDAAPYFRLFNPVVQSEKFDPMGEYIKTWLPELSELGHREIHQPWLHKEACLKKGIRLGEDYPLPIVDLKQSRQDYLQRIDCLKAVS